MDIQKNKKEIIRVETSEFKGNKFIDCRVYFKDENSGKYLPTKKGIAFSHKVAKQVIEAILDEAENGDYDNQQSDWRNFKTN
tara:strand:+ start:641 stop:886 length:246 start_codon:yes stop_codon:yes gene_type:complete